MNSMPMPASGTSSFAAILPREGELMAEFFVQDPHQPTHRHRIGRQPRHLRCLPSGRWHVRKGIFRPGREIGVNPLWHRRQTRPHFAAEFTTEAEPGHRMRERDRPIEVGAAEPDAMAREDPHLARLDEEGGEIGGSTANVDDQPGAAAFPERPAGERRGLWLGQNATSSNPAAR